MCLIQAPGIPRTAKHYGTLHNVLVFTTRPEDKRLYNFVNGMKADDRGQLLAIHEHEGHLFMVWNEDIPEMYYQGEKFTIPGGDVWAVKWNYVGTGHGPRHLGFSRGRWESREHTVTLHTRFKHKDGAIRSAALRYESSDGGGMQPMYDFSKAEAACQNWCTLLKAYRESLPVARAIYCGTGNEESNPAVMVVP